MALPYRGALSRISWRRGRHLRAASAPLAHGPRHPAPGPWLFQAELGGQVDVALLRGPRGGARPTGGVPRDPSSEPGPWWIVGGFLYRSLVTDTTEGVLLLTLSTLEPLRRYQSPRNPCCEVFVAVGNRESPIWAPSGVGRVKYGDSGGCCSVRQASREAPRCVIALLRRIRRIYEVGIDGKEVQLIDVWGRLLGLISCMFNRKRMAESTRIACSRFSCRLASRRRGTRRLRMGTLPARETCPKSLVPTRSSCDHSRCRGRTVWHASTNSKGLSRRVRESELKVTLEPYCLVERQSA